MAGVGAIANLTGDVGDRSMPGDEFAVMLTDYFAAGVARAWPLLDQRQQGAELVGSRLFQPLEKHHFSTYDLDPGGSHAFDGS